MTPRTRVKLLAVLNCFAFLLLLLTNILSTTLEFNGYTQSKLTELHQTSVTPAEYCYLPMWGAIFFLLLLFTAWQLVLVATGSLTATWLMQRIGPAFLAVSVLNALSLVAMDLHIFWLGFLVLLAILAALLFIYIRLGIHYFQPHPVEDIDMTGVWRGMHYICVSVPFSLYLGWTAFSIIPYAALMFVDSPLHWSWGGPYVGALSLALGALIVFLVLFRSHDFVFACGFAWGVLAIAVHHRHDALRLVFLTAVSTSLAVLAVAALTLGFAVWLACRTPYRPLPAHAGDDDDSDGLEDFIFA